MAADLGAVHRELRNMHKKVESGLKFAEGIAGAQSHGKGGRRSPRATREELSLASSPIGTPCLGAWRWVSTECLWFCGMGDAVPVADNWHSLGNPLLAKITQITTSS